MNGGLHLFLALLCSLLVLVNVAFMVVSGVSTGGVIACVVSFVAIPLNLWAWGNREFL